MKFIKIYEGDHYNKKKQLKGNLLNVTVLFDT